MNFSVNQNRQLYVAKQIGDLSTEGDLKVTAQGGDLYFNHKGKGGITRSDLIKIDNICYLKLTQADELAIPLKKFKVVLSNDVNGGIPIKGQDYILNIIIKNFVAAGDDNVYIKHGCVHVTTKTVNAEDFYKELKNSLIKNFSRDLTQYFEFESDATGLTITEKDQSQYWVKGFTPYTPVNFEVIPSTVTYDGEELQWAKSSNEEGLTKADGQPVPNGYMMADLEYFCMGEKGDQYRDTVPGAIKMPVKYMVDETKEYDVIDLHYFFSDSGVAVQKSEKDITILVEKGKGEDIIKAIAKAANIKYLKKADKKVESMSAE